MLFIGSRKVVHQQAGALPEGVLRQVVKQFVAVAVPIMAEPPANKLLYFKEFGVCQCGFAALANPELLELS